MSVFDFATATAKAIGVWTEEQATWDELQSKALVAIAALKQERDEIGAQRSRAEAYWQSLHREQKETIRAREKCIDELTRENEELRLKIARDENRGHDPGRHGGYGYNCVCEPAGARVESARTSGSAPSTSGAGSNPAGGAKPDTDLLGRIIGIALIIFGGSLWAIGACAALVWCPNSFLDNWGVELSDGSVCWFDADMNFVRWDHG